MKHASPETEEDVSQASRVRYRLADSVRTVDLEGERVFLDLVRGEYFGLDAIGTRAWSGIVQGRSIGDVARELALEYEVTPSQLTRDLLRFVADLEESGLLVVDAS